MLGTRGLSRGRGPNPAPELVLEAPALRGLDNELFSWARISGNDPWAPEQRVETQPLGGPYGSSFLLCPSRQMAWDLRGHSCPAGRIPFLHYHASAQLSGVGMGTEAMARGHRNKGRAEKG